MSLVAGVQAGTVADPQSGQTERAALASTASMETIHAAYLDLSANITDLRSRVDQWQKGDEASLGIAQEKLDRIEIVLGSTAWPQAESSAIAKTKAAVGLMTKALDAKDPAAAVVAAKAFGDASHDVTHAHYSDWLPGLKDARFTPMAPHAAYLDLAANIADLRSRVDLWQKGDEASLGIAQEKLDRVGVLAKHLAAVGALPKPVTAIDRSLPAIGSALAAKDAARAQESLKPLADASHDLTHDFYVWLNGSAGASDAACVQASYLDLSANIADLKSRVSAWEKGDDASLGIAQEKLDRTEGVLRHVAWPKAITPAVDKARAAIGPIRQGLGAKDAAATVKALTALSDASHDITHAYYADWLPGAYVVTNQSGDPMAGMDMSGDMSGHNMTGHDMGSMGSSGAGATAPSQPTPTDSSGAGSASGGAHAHGADAATQPSGPNWPILAGFFAPFLHLGAVVLVRRPAFGRGPLNLLDYRVIRWVMKSPLYPAVFQYVAVLVFGLIVFELLFGPAKAHDNFGTAMTWVLWWPLIPLLFVVFGRFWCAVCPFATLSDLVQKVVGQNRRVPQFLKKYGIWIIDATFILITWSDHTFGVVENPRGSGVLLVGLILGVVTAGLLFERRTWCRYLCFLGGLSGNYSRSGALELRATPDKCAKCNVQACFKGSVRAPGCPMFEFPRTMDTNARCNLCGYCVKSCPNDSVRISPRLPTSELWGLRKPKFEEAFLACVIMGIVFVQNITMLAIWPGILKWLEGVVGTNSYFVTFTITFAVLMALPVGALFLASYLARRLGGLSVLGGFTLFGYALIPLDLAGHLAHNLFHLLAEGKAVAFTALQLFGIQSTGSAAILDTPTIQVLQYALILVGTLGSLYTAHRMAHRKGAAGSEEPRSFAALAPIGALFVILGVVNIALFYLPMAMRM